MQSRFELQAKRHVTLDLVWLNERVRKRAVTSAQRRNGIASSSQRALCTRRYAERRLTSPIVVSTASPCPSGVPSNLAASAADTKRVLLGE